MNILVKNFNLALFYAYLGPDAWIDNYYTTILEELVNCFNALGDTKEAYRAEMEKFRIFLREDAGEEYEAYLTNMSIK